MSEVFSASGLERVYHLSDAWSASDFGRGDINSYARELLTRETRRGLITLALLSFMVNTCLFLYGVLFNQNVVYVPAMSTHGLLVILSIHIAFSAMKLNEIRVLNLLGMALLVVTGAALMLLAHRTNSMSVALIVGFATLFMVIPVMTWGLRESLSAIVLIYLLLTFSSLSVGGRFDPQTLWTLQFLVVGSAVIALVLVARNVGIRKHDIRSRFDLDQARQEMQKLSNIDPLTGCWNRRFLQENFSLIAEKAELRGDKLELSLMDIDLFKSYNDTFGHHIGDQILQTLAEVVKEQLPDSAIVMRLGGDEFAVLYAGGGLHELVRSSLVSLKRDKTLKITLGGREVTVSAGIAEYCPSNIARSSLEPSTFELDQLYQSADQQLYLAKRLSQVDVPTQVTHHRMGA